MRPARSNHRKRRGVRHYPRRLPRQEEIELALELVAPRGWVYIGIRSVTDAKRQRDRVDKCNPGDVQL